MKEGWSCQRPVMIKQINKYHYYKKIDSPHYSHLSLCGMFFLKRLKTTLALDSGKCKRCLKSLGKEK
jgi:hypothetical protein